MDNYIMSILHDAYTALLAGLTHKTGNEIHWQDNNNNPITIEPIDAENERYIVRTYYSNGQKYHETEYQNNIRHGKHIEWFENGEKSAEREYENDRPHGKHIEWYNKDNRYSEYEYCHGKRHGKFIWFDLLGNKTFETEYKNNFLVMAYHFDRLKNEYK